VSPALKHKLIKQK